MRVAKGDDCDQFPQPKERASFSGFYGRYSSGSGGGRSYSYRSAPYTGAGDNSAGGGDYRGYDPRLYEAPPQQSPQTRAPSPEPPAERPGGQAEPRDQVESGPPQQQP